MEERSLHLLEEEIETWWLDVTDLKQYACCPRLIYYRYTWPTIRPLTLAMQAGKESHRAEAPLHEVRRSLRRYGLAEGERLFHQPLISRRLGLKGRVDLLIVSPSLAAPLREATIVEYKDSERQSQAHFMLQLAAYALMVEEELGLPIRGAFLYSLPLRQAEPVPLTRALRRRVETTVAAIRQSLQTESLPGPTAQQRRCPLCEFRRFCNDVV
ncbi:CRISPR-associated protein Cas4 [Thermogemmatispora onikobensis]|jgi:CRISPR-associated exonuclease Cas4|uniref:CRISPR-associated protein Cas4 n=1 Tax=Thermogemmatispora onikobensis TaxID=732234 RepID=UPI000853D216|nr:CRISPR-associated protein Cas4 [Thermogemmatispora onikobensis]